MNHRTLNRETTELAWSTEESWRTSEFFCWNFTIFQLLRIVIIATKCGSKCAFLYQKASKVSVIVRAV